MRSNIAVLFSLLLFCLLLTACGLPGGANYSSPTIRADAVTAAEPYTSSPAADVPVPTSAPEDKSPHITKDPTDETVSPGGSAWFVARAENCSSMCWELTDTYGNVYSPEDAESLNPGMDTEQTGDAVSLSNVPLSMDGWQIRAVFESENGHLATEWARLTVIDREDPYSCILMRYSKAFAFGTPSEAYCQVNGLSLKAARCHRVGVAFIDLDENKTVELVVASWEPEGGPDINCILEVYTVTDSAPCRVFSSGASGEMHYLGDSRFLSINEGNCSRSYGIYRLSGDFLLYEEVWQEEWEAADPSLKTWTHRIDNSIGYSDSNPINSAEARQAVDAILARIQFPALTPVS